MAPVVEHGQRGSFPPPPILPLHPCQSLFNRQMTSGAKGDEMTRATHSLKVPFCRLQSAGTRTSLSGTHLRYLKGHAYALVLGASWCFVPSSGPEEVPPSALVPSSATQA